jgi:hypothetical protein
MSLVVHDSILSDDDESPERCFPMDGPSDWSTIPPDVRRNRDFSDLFWALACRNCSYAVNADGFCICTHNASDDPKENKEPDAPEKKRRLEAVYDLTTPGKPKLIDFINKKK